MSRVAGSCRDTHPTTLKGTLIQTTGSIRNPATLMNSINRGKLDSIEKLLIIRGNMAERKIVTNRIFTQKDIQVQDFRSSGHSVLIRAVGRGKPREGRGSRLVLPLEPPSYRTFNGLNPFLKHRQGSPTTIRLAVQFSNETQRYQCYAADPTVTNTTSVSIPETGQEP